MVNKRTLKLVLLIHDIDICQLWETLMYYHCIEIFWWFFERHYDLAPLFIDLIEFIWDPESCSGTITHIQTFIQYLENMASNSQLLPQYQLPFFDDGSRSNPVSDELNNKDSSLSRRDIFELELLYSSYDWGLLIIEYTFFSCYQSI